MDSQSWTTIITAIIVALTSIVTLIVSNRHNTKNVQRDLLFKYSEIRRHDICVYISQLLDCLTLKIAGGKFPNIRQMELSENSEEDSNKRYLAFILHIEEQIQLLLYKIELVATAPPQSAPNLRKAVREALQHVLSFYLIWYKWTYAEASIHRVCSGDSLEPWKQELRECMLKVKRKDDSNNVQSDFLGRLIDILNTAEPMPALLQECNAIKDESTSISDQILYDDRGEIVLAAVIFIRELFSDEYYAMVIK